MIAAIAAGIGIGTISTLIVIGASRIYYYLEPKSKIG